MRSEKKPISIRPDNRLHRERGWFASHWAQLYVAVSAVVAMGYAVTFARRRAPWPLGDWLINYKGGFVRRGFPGELLWRGAHRLHLPLVGVVATLQCLLVLSLVACLWPLAARVTRDGSAWWEKALLVSPAGLAFFWLDPELIFRKELALFALLGLLTAVLRRSKPVSDVWVTVFLAIGCPLLMLAHEALACFLPYLVALVYLGRPGVLRGLKIWWLPGVLTGAALVAATMHPGNGDTATAVCNSVGGWGGGLCMGPIGYLAIPRWFYAAEVREMMHDGRMMMLFAVTIALALAPVVAGLMALWRKPVSRETRVVPTVAFVLSGVGSVVLYLQAQDWSRWTYIHVMCLMFVLLYAVEIRDAAGVSASEETRATPVWAVVALVVYALVWRLPESTLKSSRDYKPYGYVALMLRLDHHV